MGSRKVIYLIVIFLLVISIVYIPGFVGEEDKHKVITEEEFQTKLENKDYDFSWCIFPFEVNLSGKTLMNADFSNAVFEEEVNFKNTTFKNTDDKNTKFIQTHFKRNAHFEDVIFEGKATFNGAVFEQSVSFKCTTNEKTFQEGAGFSHTTFGDEEKEEECTIDFTNVIFDDYANFEYAIFNGKTIFEKAKFLDGAIRFVHAEFYYETNFKGAEFNEKGGYTTFEDAIFEDEADFRGITFSGKAIFDGATFKGKSQFQGFNKDTIFENHAIFDNVTFEKSVDFSGATFKGYTSFKGETVFYDSVNFTNVDFDTNATFYETIFEGRVIFLHTAMQNLVKTLMAP